VEDFRPATDRRPGQRVTKEKSVGMRKSERSALLSTWIKPSSATEQDQQDRAERMVKAAIAASAELKGVSLATYTKGSYPNNTNVRQDSDVDVVVELQACSYYDGTHPGAPSRYKGPWTPQVWREAVVRSLVEHFGASEVDSTGRIAINVRAKSGSRPSADVVPSFNYNRYDSAATHSGSCVFPRDGSAKVVNWPDQQLANGKTKNAACGQRYKAYVRALKNSENHLSGAGTIADLPSYFMECLVYNVPNQILQTGDLDAGWRATLAALWGQLDGSGFDTMVEPNELKWLFKGTQKWSVADGKSLVLATWKLFGYGDN
jgi:hypothetical protein